MCLSTYPFFWLLEKIFFFLLLVPIQLGSTQHVFSLHSPRSLVISSFTAISFISCLTHTSFYRSFSIYPYTFMFITLLVTCLASLLITSHPLEQWLCIPIATVSNISFRGCTVNSMSGYALWTLYCSYFKGLNPNIELKVYSETCRWPYISAE
jgi:hypothetical protein